MRRLIVIASVGGLLIGGGVIVREAAIHAESAQRRVAARSGVPRPVVPEPAPMPPGELRDDIQFPTPPQPSLDSGRSTIFVEPARKYEPAIEIPPPLTSAPDQQAPDGNPTQNSFQFLPAAPPYQRNTQSPLDQKRTRIVELAKAYASMLAEPELDEFLAEFEGTVKRKRAELDLQETRARLQKLIEVFPGTPAAEKARQMLDAPQNAAPEVPEPEAAEEAREPDAQR